MVKRIFKGGNCNCNKIFGGKKTRKRGKKCHQCGKLKHGGFPVSVLPGPFIGKPWGPTVSQWPAADGISGDRNYLSQNLYNRGDPQTAMLLNDARVSKVLGGKKKRKTRKTGGSFVQDLVNFGRTLEYNIGSSYNTIRGYPAPTNPLPYVQNKMQ